MLGLARARWDAGVHASPDDARDGGDDEGEDGRSNADLDIVARCVSVVARPLTDPALTSLGQSGRTVARRFGPPPLTWGWSATAAQSRRVWFCDRRSVSTRRACTNHRGTSGSRAATRRRLDGISC